MKVYAGMAWPLGLKHGDALSVFGAWRYRNEVMHRMDFIFSSLGASMSKKVLKANFGRKWKPFIRSYYDQGISHGPENLLCRASMVGCPAGQRKEAVMRPDLSSRLQFGDLPFAVGDVGSLDEMHHATAGRLPPFQHRNSLFDHRGHAGQASTILIVSESVPGSARNADRTASRPPISCSVRAT